MPRGRPPNPGTAEEKAAARRERVRQNVRALRERRKQEIALLNDVDEPGQLKLEWVDSDRSTEGSAIDNDDPSTSSASGRILSTVTRRTKLAPGAFFVVNQRNHSSMKFPRSVNTKGPYAAVIMGTVRSQFLPDAVYLPPAISKTSGKPWESDQFLWTPCAFWITTAHSMASSQDTSLLKTAVLAIGMLLKSMEHKDSSLRIAALEMYRRCLAGIRRVIEPLHQPGAKRPKDTVSIYLACHAAAMFELVQNNDMSATMHHSRGISSLISHLGEDIHTDGQSIPWMLLQDYRFAEMGLCLKFRYASLSSVKRRNLADADRDNLQLSKRPVTAFGSGNHSMLVTIVDIADEITDVMVQLDQVPLTLQDPRTPWRIGRMIRHLDSINSNWDVLYSQLSARYGTAFEVINSEVDDIGLGYLRFKTFDIGAAWCYNLNAQLHCLEEIIRGCKLLLQIKWWTPSLPSPPDSQNSAKSPESTESTESIDTDVFEEAYIRQKIETSRDTHRKCCIQLSQCLQYFLQTDKGITGLSLSIFPLDTASCMLEVEMARLDVDIHEAKAMQAPVHRLSTLSQQRAELEMARLVCLDMQGRAEAYGLPSFYTTGSANVEDGDNTKYLHL